LDEENDFRRKPNPGMIIEAIVENSLDKSKCTFIGDSVNDVFAGKRAGVQTILINKKPVVNSNPDYKFQSLKELNNHLSRILVELIK
jgi:D-glycero-D-manno-heptose 1,7-bisphosphate phosphatase